MIFLIIFFGLPFLAGVITFSQQPKGFGTGWNRHGRIDGAIGTIIVVFLIEGIIFLVGSKIWDFLLK